jgi:hypothetical protein
MLIGEASEYDCGAESSDPDVAAALEETVPWARDSCKRPSVHALLVSRLRHAAREGLIFRALTTLQALTSSCGYSGVSAVDEPDENGESAMTLAAARGHAPIVHAFLVKSSEMKWKLQCVTGALVRLPRNNTFVFLPLFFKYARS